MMPTITNNNAFLMAMGNGSRIEIHAKDADKDSWTQISETVDAGENTLTLSEHQFLNVRTAHRIQ